MHCFKERYYYLHYDETAYIIVILGIIIPSISYNLHLSVACNTWNYNSKYYNLHLRIQMMWLHKCSYLEDILYGVCVVTNQTLIVHC